MTEVGSPPGFRLQSSLALVEGTVVVPHTHTPTYAHTIPARRSGKADVLSANVMGIERSAAAIPTSF